MIALNALTPKTVGSANAGNRGPTVTMTLSGFIQSGRMMWRRECAAAIRTRMLRHQRIQQAAEPRYRQTIERYRSWDAKP